MPSRRAHSLLASSRDPLREPKRHPVRQRKQPIGAQQDGLMSFPFRRLEIRTRFFGFCATLWRPSTRPDGGQDENRNEASLERGRKGIGFFSDRLSWKALDAFSSSLPEQQPYVI